VKTPGRVRFVTWFTPTLAIVAALLLCAVLALSLVSGCAPSSNTYVSLRLVKPPSAPRDASVMIDEEYVAPLGVVAARGVKLPYGEHRITVEKEGYFPWDRLVFSDRDDIKLDVELVPIPD
jgi:hypothetical protein